LDIQTERDNFVDVGERQVASRYTDTSLEETVHEQGVYIPVVLLWTWYGTCGLYERQVVPAKLAEPNAEKAYGEVGAHITVLLTSALVGGE
jgi:hypothetical protein